MRSSTPFYAKDFGFFAVYVCPYGQGGREVQPVRAFARKGRGVNFHVFVLASLMDGPKSSNIH